MSSNTKTTAMKEQATPPLVPKLRFPGFRGVDGWQPKTLAEICHLITNGKANAQDHEEDGEFPLFDRSAVIKKSSEFMFDAEAVILPGEGMRFVPKYFRGKFNLHQRAYALMKHQGDGRFVYQSLDYFQDALAEKAVKSTVLSLRLPIVEDFVIGCPTPAEQQKIAECLSSVDELIAAQARKLDALKTHKKGLMQQLFPREGETQPRLRFPEFQNAGEWEESNLGDHFDPIRNGFVGTATPFYTTSEGIRYLQGRHIKEGKIESNNLIYITQAFHERQRKSQLKHGDILMVQSGHVGECAVVTNDFVGCNCHAVIILTPKRKVSSEFFVHYFYSQVGKLAIFQITTGNTIKHILSSELKELPVFTPSLIEQQRIADCLTSLDALIAAQTQKYEALKTHKKGLMQQLLPSPEEPT
jgi:type I restriction enzyme S subunit